MRNLKQLGSILAFTIIAPACGIATDKLPDGGSVHLTARLTQPDIVQLDWEPAEGASGYLLEVSLGDEEYFEVADIPADQVEYMDYLVPELTEARYRLTVLDESGEGSVSEAVITTGARIPNPMNITPYVDEAGKVSQAIGIEGGSLTLVDSAGTQYLLEVPAGAVEAETTFSLTPLTRLEDWPLDGEVLAAVKVEPEDILMAEPVILSITLGDVPANAEIPAIGFASLASGEDFFLQPMEFGSAPAADSPAHVVRLARPSPAPRGPTTSVVNPKGIRGIGQGSRESIANHVKSSTPKDPSAARNQKEVAAKASDDELAPLEKIDDVKPLEALDPAQKYELVEIKNEIMHAEDCSAVLHGILRLQEWNFNHTASGEDAGRQQRALDVAVEKAAEMLEKAVDECEKARGRSSSSSVNCAKFISNRMNSRSPSKFWKSFIERMDKANGPQYKKFFKERLDKCKRSYSVSGNVGDLKIQGRTCDPTKPFGLKWTGPSASGTMDFTPESDTSGKFKMNGTASGIPFKVDGNYKIKLSETGGGGILEFTGTGTVAGPGGGPASLTLTEIPACSK